MTILYRSILVFLICGNQIFIEWYKYNSQTNVQMLAICLKSDLKLYNCSEIDHFFVLRRNVSKFSSRIQIEAVLYL